MRVTMRGLSFDNLLHLRKTRISKINGSQEEEEEEEEKKESSCKRLRWSRGRALPKFAGSNPAETVGFLGRKNPQHAFSRRGSKAVGPMS